MKTLQYIELSCRVTSRKLNYDCLSPNPGISVWELALYCT